MPLRLVEIFQRCTRERARRGMTPFRYVVVLTKTDLCESLGSYSDQFTLVLIHDLGISIGRLVSSCVIRGCSGLLLLGHPH